MKKAASVGEPLFFVSLKCLQPFPLEEDHVKHPYGDGGISQVENRGEEADAEHVDDPAVQPTGIMEHLAVEHAVDDVAEGSCGD